MNEAKYLGNLAIRYAIAYNLPDIYKNFDEIQWKSINNRSGAYTGYKLPLDTRIYKILTKERKYLESGIVATLSRNFAIKLFKNSNKDAWSGKKSLPTYKSLFCPIRNNIKIEKTDQQFIIHPAGFAVKWLSDVLIEKICKQLSLEKIIIDKNQKKLSFISCFSWKDGGPKTIIDRIYNGDYKLCDSQFKKSNKGLILYLTYKFESEKILLDSNKICGVDLGYNIPAVCATNFSDQREYIGDGNDVWAARSNFRNQRKREQKRLGLYSKTKQWKQSDKEHNWVQTYYHALTRKIIKFCLQNDCGKIHIEDLSNLRKKELNEEKSEYKRLIWVPSKFKELLSYKAKEVGIELITINPQNTSRRCNKCGCISKDNRQSQSKFVCIECGYKVNADYNAAKNISEATEDSYEILEKLQ